MNVGSLFSGIGGFDLGLERAGMRVVWQCESDPFCRQVLSRHWSVPIVPDVRSVVAYADGLEQPQEPQGDDGEHGERQAVGGRQLISPRAGASGGNRRGTDAEGTTASGGHAPGAPRPSDRPLPVPVPYVDVICGGFPCQDISVAGRGEGIDGARSGLWSEMFRVVCELRPRYVVVENVAALLSRGLGRVVGDLASVGYDAEWDCLPASAFGAPHRRDRLWIVAYPCGDDGGSWGPGRLAPSGPGEPEPERSLQDVADANDAGRIERRRPEPVRPQLASAKRGGEGLADSSRDAEAGPTSSARSIGERTRAGGQRGASGGGLDEGRSLDDAGCGRYGAPQGEVRAGRNGSVGAGRWFPEPDVGRVAHGVPQRVDRLAALGNALVPQIAEWLGRRILEHEEGRVAA